MALQRRVRETIDWHDLAGASHVRGFNYQPSWGATGPEIWLSFDAERYRAELRRGLELFPGFNTVRIWLSYQAYIEAPRACVTHVQEAIQICSDLGLLVMPVLFTRWTGNPPFDPIRTEHFVNADLDARFGSFVDDIVIPQTDNRAILAWDLCNEPVENAQMAHWFGSDQVPLDVLRREEVRWLHYVHARVKRHDPGAATCIGFAWDVASGRDWEALSDLMTPHMYLYSLWAQAPEQQSFEEAFAARVRAYLDDLRSRNVAKPVVSTETCWGAVDDAARAAIIRDTLSVLEAHGVGFLAHALWTSPVADLHPETLGPVGDAGYMAFIRADGLLRPHHDIMRQYLDSHQEVAV